MKKILFAVSVFMLAAAQAEACSYGYIAARPGISAAQRAELAKDQQLVDQLRRDMNTVCTTTKTAAISSCQYSKGSCADLPGDVQAKFQYDFGADGSLKGMVSPEERTKNAEIINRIYDKWKS
jgi:hypothetical protein